MSYIRVIPRDLFNEANLLKCYGRVYLNLEEANTPGVTLEHWYGDGFEIDQNPDDGSITIVNVKLHVRGKAYALHRPLNSREAWPLYLVAGDDEIAVFDDEGDFTPDMVAFLRGDQR